MIGVSGRPRFLLVLEDRKILNSMLNFLKTIVGTYARAQVHAILAAWVRVMVKVLSAAAHLESEIPCGPILFASMLDMAAQIRKEETEHRRTIYLDTVLHTMMHWLKFSHLY